MQTAMRQQNSGQRFDRDEIADLFGKREASRHSVSKINIGANANLEDLENSDKIGGIGSRKGLPGIQILRL